MVQIRDEAFSAFLLSSIRGITIFMAFRSSKDHVLPFWTKLLHNSIYSTHRHTWRCECYVIILPKLLVLVFVTVRNRILKTLPCRTIQHNNCYTNFKPFHKKCIIKNTLQWYFTHANTPTTTLFSCLSMYFYSASAT